MGAKKSAEMVKALELVMRKNDPLSAYAAAKEAGISQSAISQDATYRKFMDSKKGKKNAK